MLLLKFKLYKMQYLDEHLLKKAEKTVEKLKGWVNLPNAKKEAVQYYEAKKHYLEH